MSSYPVNSPQWKKLTKNKLHFQQFAWSAGTDVSGGRLPWLKSQHFYFLSCVNLGKFVTSVPRFSCLKKCRHKYLSYTYYVLDIIWRDSQVLFYKIRTLQRRKLQHRGQGTKVAPSGFRPSPSEAPPHPALEYTSSLLIGCQAWVVSAPMDAQNG